MSAKQGNQNKIYRTPSTPPPMDLMEKEKGFVLDSIAVASISNDYSKANPKFGPVIPPYNAQKDKHPKGYFKFHGVNKTLEKTEQVSISLHILTPWSCLMKEFRFYTAPYHHEQIYF